jgi:hypothetical protein
MLDPKLHHSVRNHNFITHRCQLELCQVLQHVAPLCRHLQFIGIQLAALLSGQLAVKGLWVAWCRAVRGTGGGGKRGYRQQNTVNAALFSGQLATNGLGSVGLCV